MGAERADLDRSACQPARPSRAEKLYLRSMPAGRQPRSGPAARDLRRRQRRTPARPTRSQPSAHRAKQRNIQPTRTTYILFTPSTYTPPEPKLELSNDADGKHGRVEFSGKAGDGAEYALDLSLFGGAAERCP